MSNEKALAKAAIQKAGDLGLSIVGDVKRVTDIVKGRLDAVGIKNLDYDSTLQTNQGKMNLTGITKIAALNALEKLKEMNRQGQLRGTDKETVYNSLLIDEIDMLGIGSPDTISKQKGGLIPATKEQKTVSQILDEIE